jgi:protoheme IX farnesyltransferase
MTETRSTFDTMAEPGFGDFVQLLKPRVMSLVVFTALVGLAVAPVHLYPVAAFSAVLFIALGAGASGALNMWWDADIDARMSRTARRPIPAGRVAPSEALFPPMIGWVAATGSVSLEAVLMFALIFMWTPPHFWALALFMKDDYSKAGVPMLTVTHGRRVTRAHILIYTLALVPFALALGFTPIGGPVYLATAGALNLWFVWGAVRIIRREEVQAEADKYAVEKAFFRFSLLYLFLHFGALLAEAVLHSAGLGAW